MIRSTAFEALEVCSVPKVLHDCVVERLVALLFSDLNHAGDLVSLAFADEVRDSHVDHENLERRDPARFIDSFEKVLRNDAF